MTEIHVMFKGMYRYSINYIVCFSALNIYVMYIVYDLVNLKLLV